MAEKIIQNPSITSGDFSFSGDAITAIAGHPVAGVGGGGTQSDYVYVPSFDDQTGDITFTLGMTGSEGKGPWHISGAQGPQGPSGTNGVDGKDGKDGKDGTNGVDGISPTFTITPTAGGTHIVISGAQGKDSFDVLSGAKGADGQDGQKGADGDDGYSPTITLTPVNSDASHNNGGTQVEITYKNGESTATTAYTAWNGNNGEGASVNLFGNNGVSVTQDGTSYTVGLSGGYYSDTLSAYSATYAGISRSAMFTDSSVSSMDQLKGSIDWGNQIAGEYVTHSGDYVTSSSQTIAGNKQYALTTAGWASVETAYLPTSGGTVSGKTTISGSNFDNTLELTRGGQANNYAHIGLNNSRGLSFKAFDDNASTNVQFDLFPNNANSALIQVQHNGTAVGNLIPAVTSTTTADITANDGILHIILES